MAKNKKKTDDNEDAKRIGLMKDLGLSPMDDPNNAAHVTALLPFGCPPLDLCILPIGMGGIPNKRLIEIYGPEGGGKTSIAEHLIAQFQQLYPDGTCAFEDVEHAAEERKWRRQGIDISKIFYGHPSTTRECLNIANEMYDMAISKQIPTPLLIIVDSIAATSDFDKKELKGKDEMDAEENQTALKAKTLTNGFRTLVKKWGKVDSYLVFINQTRVNLGLLMQTPSNMVKFLSPHQKENTPGGRALKFYAGVRLRVEPKKDIKDKHGRIIGQDADVYTRKNKVFAPKMHVRIPLMFKDGIDVKLSMLYFLSDNKLINFHKGAKSGAQDRWSFYDDESNKFTIAGWMKMIADETFYYNVIATIRDYAKMFEPDPNDEVEETEIDLDGIELADPEEGDDDE